MKKYFKSLLCCLLAVALTACHSGGIVEKPVTEPQSVPVNTPTAVEQALDEMDYPYIDETEYCLSLVREYQKTGEWPAELESMNEAEADSDNLDREGATESVDEKPETVFADFVYETLWHISVENTDQEDIDREIRSWIEAPDSTCMTAQQAANCAGRLASSFSPENEEEIHLLCVKSKFETIERYYWFARIGKPANEWWPGKWLLCFDAVTGELDTYLNVSEAYNDDHDSYPWKELIETVREEEVKDQFQRLLDTLGNGQQCESIRRDEFFMVDYTIDLLYDITVDGKVYAVTWYPDTKQIGSAERHYSVELVNRTAFTAPLDGELSITEEVTPSHNGVDYTAPNGTPVYAATDGTVTVARYHHGYGNYVVIEHEGGTIRTLYAHLNDLNVEEGQTVTAGQLIGTVGSTGETTGNCLHFEVRSYGQRIDPSIIDFVKR